MFLKFRVQCIMPSKNVQKACNEDTLSEDTSQPQYLLTFGGKGLSYWPLNLSQGFLPPLYGFRQAYRLH